MEPHALLLPGIEDLAKSLNEVSLFLDWVLVEGALSFVLLELVPDAGSVLDMGNEVLEFDDFGFLALQLVDFVIQLHLKLPQFLFLLELLQKRRFLLQHSFIEVNTKLKIDYIEPQ